MSANLEDLLEFRAMQELDLDAVMTIEDEAHAFPWSRGIFQDCIRVGYYCPVLVSKNNLIAYAVMSIAAGEAHIFNVCVNKQMRKQGFGRKMMLHLIDVAKLKKVTTVFLEVRPTNLVAQSLYSQLGFSEVGKRKDYYPAENETREDAVIMAIELDSQSQNFKDK